MCSLHMMLQRRGIHCLTTLLATYPGSLPFPKGWSLPCSSSFVRFISLFYPDEPRSEYHSLGLIQVCLKSYPIKNSYHCRQRYLHSDRISPYYPYVIFIEAYFVFPRQPPETVLSLLGYTDILEGLPKYCIHYDIKQCWGNWVSLRHPYPCDEGSPILLP